MEKLSSFFGDTGEGLEQPQKSPRGLQFQGVWDFWEWLLQEEVGILFLDFILESQIQEILGNLGNQCLQFCLWMGGSGLDPLGIPGFDGSRGDLFPSQGFCQYLLCFGMTKTQNSSTTDRKSVV